MGWKTLVNLQGAFVETEDLTPVPMWKVYGLYFFINKYK